MYLKALGELEQEGRSSVSRLARQLGVSTASASEMVHRLATRGWVRIEDHEPRLTSAGRHLALRTVRRHRLAERLLTDTLQLPWEQVHEPACALEHAMSDVVADRIDVALGHPATCPHGQPIPAPDGTVILEAGIGLDAVSRGYRARVLRVSREEPELLSYLGTLGLVPGAAVVVDATAPFGGPILIRIGRARYALGRDVAAMITVDDPTKVRGG